MTPQLVISHGEEPLKKSWGHEVILGGFPGSMHGVLGKVLYRKAGAPRAAMQYHRQKCELCYVQSGSCWVYGIDADGNAIRYHLGTGMVATIPAGARHSIEAITDAVLFEVSTYHLNDRVADEEAERAIRSRFQDAQPPGPREPDGPFVPEPSTTYQGIVLPSGMFTFAKKIE